MKACNRPRSWSMSASRVGTFTRFGGTSFHCSHHSPKNSLFQEKLEGFSAAKKFRCPCATRASQVLLVAIGSCTCPPSNWTPTGVPYGQPSQPGSPNFQPLKDFITDIFQGQHDVAGSTIHEVTHIFVNGFRIVSWVSMRCPSCRSSENRIWQFASSADATIIES